MDEQPTTGLSLNEGAASLAALLTGQADPETDNHEVSEESTGEAEEHELDQADEDIEYEDDAVEDDDDDYDEQEPEEPDTFTVKIDGTDEQVTLEELQAGYQRQESFTRKSQELAEQRRAFDEQQNAVFQERAQYAELLPQLEDYLETLSAEEPPDFDEIYEKDPAAGRKAEKAWEKRQEQLRSQREAAKAERERLQQEAQDSYNQQLQQVLQAESQRLPEVIPEWKDQSVAKKEMTELREYLLEQGITEQEADSLVRADYLKVLRKAMLFDRGAKKATKARRKTVKPGTKTQPRRKSQRRARERLAQSGDVRDAGALLAERFK